MPQKTAGNGPSEPGFPPLPGLDGLLQGGEALPDPAAEPEIGEEEGRKADPQDRKGRERQQLLHADAGKDIQEKPEEPQPDGEDGQYQAQGGEATALPRGLPPRGNPLSH